MAATVEDLTTAEGDQAYLVLPDGPTVGGVMFLHWFDEAPTANRGQFLAEARDLAEIGVASVLPQLRFPWAIPPMDLDADIARILEERERLRRAHTILTEVAGAPIGVVGHDFGAMHGMFLLADIEVTCAVWIAPTPRWSDWFLRFWSISTDRYDYMRALQPFDPVTTVASGTFPILFQFAERDFYIAAMTSMELVAAAADRGEHRAYGADHAMDDDDVRSDRRDFLLRHLGVDQGPGSDAGGGA